MNSSSKRIFFSVLANTVHEHLIKYSWTVCQNQLVTKLGKHCSRTLVLQRVCQCVHEQTGKQTTLVPVEIYHNIRCGTVRYRYTIVRYLRYGTSYVTGPGRTVQVATSGVKCIVLMYDTFLQTKPQTTKLTFNILGEWESERAGDGSGSGSGSGNTSNNNTSSWKPQVLISSGTKADQYGRETRQIVSVDFSIPFLRLPRTGSTSRRFKSSPWIEIWSL